VVDGAGAPEWPDEEHPATTAAATATLVKVIPSLRMCI